MSLKRFMMKYTRPHELAHSVVGNARMVRKERRGPALFTTPIFQAARYTL